ncbi:LamG-like jellyroll fold domain-containing protein [Novosphingobium sp. Chol11]|uniref:glycosyl hydrolase 2 galactose-binding domain-containing protein n=1 Tax=Novosphingobium sp. Chol11 TaxID=1385763 RepID=UPI0025F4A8DF|nr:LamG-like jellyroll fold domain-containing protein [Novosphingobium sp. Chol11]
MIGSRFAWLVLAALLAPTASAQTPLVNGGPYNARFLEGGIGIDRALPAGAPLLAAGAAFSYSTWLRPAARQPGFVPLIAVGEPTPAGCRCLGLDDGRLAFAMGETLVRAGQGTIAEGRWTHVAAVSDGASLRLYVDGREVAHRRLAAIAAAPLIAIAPARTTLPRLQHFGGAMVGALVAPVLLTPASIAAAAKRPPDFDLVQMLDVGVGWVWQKQANIGLFAQQDAWTLPQGKGGFSSPVATPPPAVPLLDTLAPGRWRLNGWRLIEAPRVTATGAELSSPGADVMRWYPATVPGTVLTTLIDRGVYPDPYYGLNNLAIPEKLARQDYWYRASFTIPAQASGKRLRLQFGGINYAAQIWINGHQAGTTSGAFTRGTFAFEAVPGENVVAVRVSPPPHPGIPHEQSIAGGVGENGGQLAIDGPTFVASEGWDWIPGIRDRNTGL